MPKTCYILLLVLWELFYSISLISQTEQYRFDQLNAKDGFSSTAVYAILKDSQGFLWLGTVDGLYRYDGYRFKHYVNDPSDSTSISGNAIFVLFEDKDQILWVGTASGIISKYDRFTDSFKTFYLNQDQTDEAGGRIYSIYQDRSSDLWATNDNGGLHKFIDSANCFKSFKVDYDNSFSRKNKIMCIYEDKSSTYWIGTKNGLFIFDPDRHSIHSPDFIKELNGVHQFYNNNKYYSFESYPEVREELNEINYKRIIEDENDILWFRTNGGLISLDREKNIFVAYQKDKNNLNSFSDNTISEIAVDPFNKHILWVSTSWGLNRFDKRTKKVKQFLHNPTDVNSMPYSTTHSMFVDNNGIIWIGIENAGVAKLKLTTNRFEVFKVDTLLKDDLLNTPTCFCVDRRGNTWVGTDKGGLFKFNKEMKMVDNFEIDLPERICTWCNFIYTVYEDRDGLIWAGKIDNGLYLYDEEKNIFLPCELVDSIPKIRYGRINEVFQDTQGWRWVAMGLQEGLYYQRPKSDNQTIFVKVNQQELQNVGVRDFAEDQLGVLWLITEQGKLFQLLPENKESLEFTEYQLLNSESLSTSVIFFAMLLDKNNNLWLGTNQGLIRHSKNDSITDLYNSLNSIVPQMVYDIQSDKSENLWLSTDLGLVRFNPSDSAGQKSKLITLNDGVPFDEIYTYKIHFGVDDKLYVGGGRGSGNGFYRLNPNSLEDNKRIPPVVITDFKVKNEVFKLDTIITEKNHIDLDYNNNYLSFEFSALDFVDPARNQYAYMLEGLDENWIFSGNRRFANYTGLSPGTYTFRVKGSNNDGYWNEKGTSIVISISTPPWKTWWAYLLYLIFIFGILLTIIRYYMRRRQLLHQLDLEHVETDKLKEIDTMKSKFFANISHEFRTPLTLILGPMNNLLEKETKEHKKKELSVIRRNALKLHQLINQLLDLSTLEAGKMQLECSELNIVEWVRMYIQSFESLARQKKIDFIFYTETDEIKCYFDPEKMAQVLNNLLSNAFKFTERGEIKVSITPLPSPQQGGDQISTLKRDQTTEFFPLHREHKGVEIIISDTGRGIPSEKLQYIFNRFYQADDSKSRKYEGTGIGLSLVKELVELHHGTISVESEENVGTSFSITLPLGKEHLKPGEIVTRTPVLELFAKQEQDFQENVVSHEVEEVEEEKSDQPILLIVEDNADMRNYIKGYFVKEYKVLESVNGQKGFEMAVKHIPDIIISDVMMPEMNGYDLCQKLKEEENTCHIPVVLLTARSSGADRIEGLETGADDFVIKPFDGKELQVRIKNLVDQRKRLREHFNKEFGQLSSVSTAQLPSMDQQFLKKAMKIVEIHISESEFSVEDFASLMAMSRVQLHRKMKAIADLSAGDFVRSFRLKKAAEMIKAKNANIAEISYAVGFNNPSWFAESFKKQFGVLPSEFGTI